ncbi:2-(3-amino-3-carboxypropyl)histidine synthase subunit 1-like [Stegodyphus dumicola]|uniref:2-(3-amino-3-carboxypropyl)histidine synthase subunit 1-like n=1 Tax=Stegodyphus dumicola TaxID=202533 RepID=UPI0015B34A22|nr:2-(3-amino-3-carboxypropyl)histidine synthase subunit 1-like [Stegodyphus dumicola]
MALEEGDSTTVVISAKPDRKIFRPKRKMVSGVPCEISEDPALLKAISILPKNYNFEIPKTIWRIKKCEAKRIVLQFPEGLQIFSLTIADILQHFTGVYPMILGDVTYGACCIDDITATALKADLMVHYGHSCLIPVNVTSNLNMLYVFVDIKIDTLHIINTIQENFDPKVTLALLSTIQFVSTLQHVASDLRSLGYDIEIPQCKPLSPGEILGCTSPKIQNARSVIFIGDGRFHLESAMIANPTLTFYRYNPYDKTITKEYYDYDKMMSIRKTEIQRAVSANTFGVILGTLGRQGSPKVLNNLIMILKKMDKRYVVVLLSEIFPEKLKLFTNIDAWVQIACPRLSIDWGTAFPKPLLTPYELVVAVKEIEWQSKYPMDFYASQSLGNWTPNHKISSLNSKIACGNCADCSCCTEKDSIE